MPKPGIKYFAGSFLLSLVAVFVAAKAYLLLTISEQPSEQATSASIKAKNIELFAVNEEEDPLYNKFKEVSQPQNPLADEAEIALVGNDEEIAADEVLYGNADETADELTTDMANDDTKSTQDTALLDGEDTEIHDSADLAQEVDENSADLAEENAANSAQDDDESDLAIADASQAPMFTIPLKHNYNIEGGKVTVSDSADNGQIALASHDVSIYNLGTQSQADVTEPLDAGLEGDEVETPQEDNPSVKSSGVAANNVPMQAEDDDPWEVAETANKHATKNSLSIKSPQEEAEVALPAQEVQTAYKPQQNILIPIPEEIMKEENLTPQFSSSKENLQLEEELRSQNKLPPANESTDSENNNKKSGNTDGSADESGATNEGGKSDTQPTKVDGPSAPTIKVKPMPAEIPADDNEKDFDQQEESNADDSTSKSLADSITAWFSGIKTKAADIKSSVSSRRKENNEAAEDKNSGSSIFQKLLGPQEEEKNIAPSELKITFQPNKAEISGQTLEWLRAFADNTLNNDSVVVEIRVSQDAPAEIQHKRVKLLYKILEDKGVDYNKISIIFTNREPNSFIIRNVRYASEEELAKSVVKWGDNPW